METYKTTFNCPNCEKVLTIEVPKGKLVVDYLRKKSIICENCECRVIE